MIKINKDGSIWKIVTNEARVLWNEKQPLYILYSDESESLIHDKLELELVLEGKLTIGIEASQILIK